MAISSNKLSRITKLIRDHYKALAVEVLGEDAVPQEEFSRLVREGILKHGDVEHSQVAFPAVHTIGKIAASDAKMARMTPDQFWSFIDMAPPQFQAHDLDAVLAAKDLVGHAITNLGNDMVSEFETGAHEARTRARHAALATVQHEIGLGIARGATNEQIMRRLRAKVGESERDWALVVTTELHNAQDHGTAISIARAHGNDSLVYKVPRPDACRFCKKLYLTKGRPRIFKLSTLVNNGSNVGKKARKPTATEWKPVIGATHPACQCELRHLPPGFMLDASGKQVATLRKAMPDDLPVHIAKLIGHRCEA